MKAFFIPVILFLVVACILVFVVQGPKPTPNRNTAPANLAQSENSRTRTSERALERISVLPEEPSREPRYGEPVSEGTLITVVDGISGKLLPHAEVLVLAPGAHFNSWDFQSGFTDRQAFELYGIIYPTNEHAQVRIPKQRNLGFDAYIAGRTNQRFNVVTIRAADEFKLELTPSNVVAVKVVDQAGKPVEGAPVCLRRKRDGETWDLLQTVSDASGLARLELFSKLHMSDQLESSSEADYFVALKILSPTPIECGIDLHQEQTSTPVLIVPPVGEVYFEVVDSGGEPKKNLDYTFVLSMLPLEQSSTPNLLRSQKTELNHSKYVIQTARDGTALFTMVTLNQMVQAKMNPHSGLASQSLIGQGPLREGERVTFTFSESMRPSFVGRLLNEEGLAARNLRFETRIQLDGYFPETWEGPRTFWTDENGDFRWSPVRPYNLDDQPKLAISFRATNRKPRRSVIVDLSQYPMEGELDLGDLMIKVPPFLAGGQVVDWNHSPVVGINVDLEKLYPGAGFLGKDDWRRVVDVTAKTNDVGHFELHGYAGQGSYRIKVDNPQYALLEQGIELGENGLFLQLVNAWTITGSFQLQDGIDPRKLRAQLLEAEGEDWVQEQGQGQQLDESGNFRFEQEPPGLKTIALRYEDTELYSGDFDLSPEGGNRMIPPIEIIDLQQFSLHVVDENGAPIKDCWAASLRGELLGRSKGEDTLQIVTISSPPDLVVGATSRRRVVIKALAEDQVVVLRRGVPVQMLLENNPNLPEGVTMQVFLVAAQPLVGTLPKYWNTYRATQWNDGRVTLPGPGIYRVSVSLTDDSLDLIKYPDGAIVEGNFPITVQDTDVVQEFHFSLSQSEVDAAIQRLEAMER